MAKKKPNKPVSLDYVASIAPSCEWPREFPVNGKCLKCSEILPTAPLTKRVGLGWDSNWAVMLCEDCMIVLGVGTERDQGSGGKCGPGGQGDQPPGGK